MAAAAVDEGCVGETIAALLLAEQARLAKGNRLREMLTRMAEDEAHHAELAWRAVRYAIERGGESVRHLVADAYSQLAMQCTSAHRTLGFRFAACDPDTATWNAHGRVTADQQRSIVDAGLREVVLPCLRALIGADPEPPRA